jgi:hypothetical protein
VKESNTNNKNEAGTEYYYTPFNSGKVQELFTKA